MINQKGFTLLEMLVSVGLFSIAVMIIMVSLFSIINAQRKVVGIQNAQDNLRFAFEAMTKEIRTGKRFHCGDASVVALDQAQNCDFPYPNGKNSFTFLNSTGETVTYGIYNCGLNCSQLVKSSNGTLPCDVDPNDLTDCQKITSPQVVVVNRIAFYVDGSAGGDDEQSIVTVVFEGQVQDPKVGLTQINLQATVSKRGLVDQP